MPPTPTPITRRDLLATTAAGLTLLASPLFTASATDATPTTAPADPMSEWAPFSPRSEIRPEFSTEPVAGAGQPVLIIRADAREGLDGCWKKSFPIIGGSSYRFSALYRATNVVVPRRSVVVKLNWRDANGKPVPLDGPSVDGVLPQMTRMTETDFPSSLAARADGWTPVSGHYIAPSRATQLIVQLHLQWAPSSEVRWSNIELTSADPPAPRKVRLAAAHLYPRGGKTPMDNCRLYEPLIAQAADQKADLIVLGETLTAVGIGKKFHEVAESIPGPTTDYFGSLAKKHNLYIVPGLVEREGHLIYNAAALIGPDGQVVGKYRKTCLPRGEIEAGLCPGNDYPVFNTRFGRVGLMICYDGFFPEVARELSNRGAGGHRLASLGLQSPPGPRPRLRKPRLPRQQHLRRHHPRLDAKRHLRPHRPNPRIRQRVGHHRPGRN